jgi:hypothetical protein
MLATLQRLPRDAELLAFEPGCQDYCEREVDELELQGDRVYLHLALDATSRRGGSRLGPWPSWIPTRRRPCAAAGRLRLRRSLKVVDHQVDQGDDEPMEEGEQASPADR